MKKTIFGLSIGAIIAVFVAAIIGTSIRSEIIAVLLIIVFAAPAYFFMREIMEKNAD